MLLNIFNWDTLQEYTETFPFTKSKLEEIYPVHFHDHKDLEVNLIFTSEENIKTLNSQFRKKNSVTDVLSFNLGTKSIFGEIYICPKYVSNIYEGDMFDEEILRLIVHGTLHLLGEDHEGKFDETTPGSEPMFVKQEEILENILKDIN